MIYNPRILLISQWPGVKNGEYELIQKISRSRFETRVVDILGFDVETGECINGAELSDHYDFAISFHFDTPKFLNVPTYLWIANPLEFMHLRGDYRNVIFHNIRAYDDYLYNGSNLLKRHINNVIGSEWCDSNLEMFPASSQDDLVSTETFRIENGNKIFYCGVNWERGLDPAGRAQGLLDILDEAEVADFYGPSKLENNRTWDGFKSYKGEIPFDGVSMSQTMQKYVAVLALSSPAHIKSQTSSSRVFEGFAAGIPVISDENPHVRKLFGDLVYYFSGDSEEERATNIIRLMEEIKNNPGDAQSKVMRAQELMLQRFCFEPCFDLAWENQQQKTSPSSTILENKTLDIFLVHHDPDPDSVGCTSQFLNFEHVVKSASYAARVHG